MSEPTPISADRPVSLSRRRLARGAMATPVVLGAMVSKPVLAGSSSPYHCTISGQQSASPSTKTGAGKACSSLGKSHGYWKNHAWPMTNASFGSTFLLPKKDLSARSLSGSFAGGAQGSLFQDVFGVDMFAAYVSASSVTVASVQSPPASTTKFGSATLLEVLDLGGGSNNGAELGREAVTALLNALRDDSFPLSPEEVVKMYRAVCNGGIYTHASGATMTQTNVLNFWIKSHE